MESRSGASRLGGEGLMEGRSMAIFYDAWKFQKVPSREASKEDFQMTALALAGFYVGGNGSK